jgi:hypothetical protein
MSRLSRILSLTLIVASPAIAEDAVLLKPKHEPGRTRYIESHMTVDMSQSVGDAPGMKGKIERTYGVMQKITSGTEAGGKWQMTFDRVAQDFAFPGMSAMFDSDDPDNEDASPTLAAFLKPMLGMSIDLEVDAAGNISSCNGMKDILAKIEKGGPNTFAMMLKPEMTDDRAKTSWGDALLVLYPNKKVKVGDTWKTTAEINAPQLGKILTDYDCKLEKITDQAGRKVAIVGYKSVSRLTEAPAETPAAKKPAADDDDEADEDSDDKDKPAEKPAKSANQLNATSVGTAVFDAQTGEMLTRSDEGTSQIQMTLAGAGKMKIEQKLKQEIKIVPEADRNKVKAELEKKHAAEKKADEDSDDEKDEDSDE